MTKYDKVGKLAHAQAKVCCQGVSARGDLVPSSTNHAYLVYKEPGQILAALRSRFNSNLYDIVNLGIPWDWTFGAELGRSAVTFRTESGDTEFLDHYILAMLEPEQVMPVRAMINSPGFEAESQMTVYDLDDDPHTLSEGVAAWKTYFVAMKEEMIFTWSSSSPDAPVYASGDVVSGIVESHLAMMVCQDAEGPVVSRDGGLFAKDGPNGQIQHRWEVINGPIPSGSGSGAQDMTPIVQAINNLAMQNFDISLNHGQSIFSVRGTTVTG